MVTKRFFFYIILLSMNCMVNAQADFDKCDDLNKIILELVNDSSDQDKSLDISPEFAGEIDSLFKLISNPPKPENADSIIEGKIYISFIVDTSGALLCYNVEDGINPEYNSTALKYFEGLNLKFTPGKAYIKGKYIVAPFRMVMPILYGVK